MVVKYKNENIEVDQNASGADVAKQVLGAEEKKIVAVKKNGQIQDLFMPLYESCEIDFVSLESEEGKRILRHSAAHVMAHAIKTIYPTAKLTIGPATDDGFFYDIDFKSQIGEGDLEKIENEMKSIVKANFRIERKEISRKEALEMAEEEDETYKTDIIKQIPDGEKITIYKQGEWFDVCRGPHVRSTGMIKAFKLTKIAGAYLHGDQKNKMLTRIYGVAFPSKAEMEEYFARLEEAKQRDHRKLGKELGLFFFSEYAPGMPFYMPKGQTLKNILIDFWRDIHKKAGYVEIETPTAMNRKLWETSGHWDHYKDNMYTFGLENDTFAIKPMNCPGGMLYYLQNKHSYKEFPLRVGELGKVHRHEASGTLSGLLRVRCFVQDDAHIFMTPDQIESEIENVMNLVDATYKTFGLNYSVELSTMPESHIGSLAEWDMAETALSNALKHMNLDFKINPGDGAFYGPKIDIHVKDCIGREWQCGTIQLDMQLPKRFNLTYIDSDGKEKEPIMIHRVIYGSLERMIAVLIENFAGAFPLWLSPVQAIVIPVSEKFEEYAKKINEKLISCGIRTEMDLRSEKMGYKIREAQLQKIPYMVIVGEKEEQSGTISVRKRGNIEEKDVNVDEFIERLSELVRSKSLEIK